MTVDDMMANNVAQNSVDQPTNAVDEPTNAIDEPTNAVDMPVEDVQVDCVSDLVTQGGNYYALSAVVKGTQAEVELVNYRAATPTSDPTELVLWTRAVDATFTPRAFAFETQQDFLDVQRDDESQMYRGTMSGNTEFDGPVGVTCWPADLEVGAIYDPATGRCVDELGNEARNNLTWMYAVRTGFGQCATFEGQLNGEAFGYPTFDMMDLRGSDFSAAKLNFADIAVSQFEGADLGTFDFGYTNISGTMDAFTVLPDADCTVDENETTFSCTR